MLFQRLQIDRVGPSKHLLVESQQQDTRKRNELCPRLTFSAWCLLTGHTYLNKPAAVFNIIQISRRFSQWLNFLNI